MYALRSARNEFHEFISEIKLCAMHCVYCKFNNKYSDLWYLCFHGCKSRPRAVFMLPTCNIMNDERTTNIRSSSQSIYYAFYICTYVYSTRTNSSAYVTQYYERVHMQQNTMNCERTIKNKEECTRWVCENKLSCILWWWWWWSWRWWWYINKIMFLCAAQLFPYMVLILYFDCF